MRDTFQSHRKDKGTAVGHLTNSAEAQTYLRYLGMANKAFHEVLIGTKESCVISSTMLPTVMLGVASAIVQSHMRKKQNFCALARSALH